MYEVLVRLKIFIKNSSNVIVVMNIFHELKLSQI